MDARTVSADRGWQWIVEGFRMFRGQPLVWIALVVLLVVLSFAAALVPLLGPLAITLLTPVFFAGLMNACRNADQGGEPEIGHLFSAFKTHATPLVTVGGIYLVGNIVAAGVMFMIAGGASMPVMMGKGGADPNAMRMALGGLALGLVVGLAVFLPVLMAIWFAPLLIMFEDSPPVDAMKLSFSACLRNMVPFLIYGVAAMILFFIAALPLMLGLIVLMPVLVCSIYASYKDIFPPEDDQGQTASPPNPLLS